MSDSEAFTLLAAPADPGGVKVEHPPSNIEAEQACLGAILFDNAAFERVSDFLRDHHFYEPVHGRLYAAIEELVRRGSMADPILLHTRFADDGAFQDLGGIRYLADMIDRAPPATEALHYGREIVEHAVSRDLLRIADELRMDAKMPGVPAQEKIEAAERALYAVAERTGERQGLAILDVSMARALERAAEAMQHDGRLSGLSTGLADLDRKLGGLNRSDLIILGARPSMGKSALAGQVAFHVARRYAWAPTPDGGRKTMDGGVTALFSLEMSSEQLSMRILSGEADVDSGTIRTGKITPMEYGRLRDAALELQGSPLYLDDTGGLSIARLVARCRRLKRTVGLDLVVVDYLQLVTTSAARRDANRVEQMGEVSMALKALAKDLDVPVLALAQLSRQVEQREDKRPQLADLRESGSIEQDADVVMFLYREGYYLARSEPKEDTSEHLEWQDKMKAVGNEAELIIAKQRHGPIGTVKVAFEESRTRFTNLAREPRS